MCVLWQLSFRLSAFAIVCHKSSESWRRDVNDTGEYNYNKG